MLKADPAYRTAVSRAFPDAEYDPVVDCTNYLFHRHTADLPPVFRPEARHVLARLESDGWVDPVILTNSLGDKVRRQLDTLSLESEIEILGDTRQYDMDPGWTLAFDHPVQGKVQTWPVSDCRSIDLRRRVYYLALVKELSLDPSLVGVADTLSLPGALPMAMGIPFLLLRTPYTPNWCSRFVEDHPCGSLLGRLQDLPEAVRSLCDRAERSGGPS
jgi:hypothetical protein